MKRFIGAVAVLILLVGGILMLRPREVIDTSTFPRFLATWNEPKGTRLSRYVTGSDADRLIEAIAALNAAGLDEATFETMSASRKGKRVTVSGKTTLRFVDRGKIVVPARATLVGGRVIATPSVITTRLKGWETLSAEVSGAPTRGAITDRGGISISEGGQGERVASRGDLVTAARLIDRSMGPRVAGAPARRLLAGSPPRIIASSDLINGAPIRTSLDDGIQNVAAAVMRGHAGALVALDPRTGGILALVSIDDPGHPDQSSAAGAHLPGSTFKIVTAAAALESGKWSVGDPIRCPPNLEIGSVTVSNFRGEASDSFTFRQAFAHSCNTAFAIIGQRTGLARLLEVAARLGYDSNGIAGAASSSLTVPRSPDLVAKLAYGASNVRSNPIHLAGIGATIAGDGSWVEPRWVDDSKSKGRRALTRKTARSLRHLMESVVEEGTGQAAALEGWNLAGKTGTAERKLENGATVNDAWFVVLAPSSEARLVVVVYLPGGGVGGQAAAPLAREFLLQVKSAWSVRDPEAG